VLQAISQQFAGPGTVVQALRSTDLDLQPEEFVALVAPTGG
jgi:ABC-type lipoprotein export system ATPase subunit